MRWKKINFRQRNKTNTQAKPNEEDRSNPPEKELSDDHIDDPRYWKKNGDTDHKKLQEMFNKEQEDLKKRQTKMNSTISDMKNTLEGIKRLDDTEEWMRKL